VHYIFVDFCIVCRNTSINFHNYSVVVGMHNRSAYEPSRKQHQVRSIVLHEKFSLDLQLPQVKYDIALIQLRKRIQFNTEVKPICVDKSTFPPNTSCVVTGWGYTSGGFGMYTTQYATLSIKHLSYYSEASSSSSSSSSHRENGRRSQRPLYPKNITEMTT